MLLARLARRLPPGSPELAGLFAGLLGVSGILPDRCVHWNRPAPGAPQAFLADPRIEGLMSNVLAPLRLRPLFQMSKGAVFWLRSPLRLLDRLVPRQAPAVLLWLVQQLHWTEGCGYL